MLAALLDNEHFFQFIEDHRDEDSHKLALSLDPKNYEFPLAEALTQIELRKRVRSKLPIWVGNPHVFFPGRLSIEQCSSELTADYKASLVRGKTLIDLTGGLGVDTLAMSAQFEHTQYVEKEESLVKAAEHNFPLLGNSQIMMNQEEATVFLDQNDFKDTVFYADPARRDQHKKLYLLEDTQPDLRPWLPKLVNNNCQLLLKSAPMLDIKAGINALSYVKEVHVVAVGNECKEILFLCNRESTHDPIIYTIDLARPKERFQFTFGHEKDISVKAKEPAGFLYEPNAAIMKAGCFQSIAAHFEVAPLHPNSHLYSSDKVIADWPGRAFRILEITAANARQLPGWLGKKANVAIRNYPLPAEKLRQKLKLTDGGDYYVFGTTLNDNKPKVIICEKLSG